MTFSLFRLLRSDKLIQSALWCTVPEYVGDENGASVERRLPLGSNGTKQMMVDKKVDKGKVILGVLRETLAFGGNCN